MLFDDRLTEIFKKGKCKDLSPEIFYPTSERSGGRYPKDQALRDRDSVEGAQLRAAEICNGTIDGKPCVVRELCLAFALETRQEHGVWGGHTEMELKKLRQKKRANASTSS